MKKISKETINQICGQQVIIDLVSVVKELVENCVDAGASSIDINLIKSGLECIEVSDNGCGIAKSNFENIVGQRASSKLKLSEHDEVTSAALFGFRGEALHSLAAMSKLTITTRTTEDNLANVLNFDRGGKLFQIDQIPRQVGTSVKVEHLFSGLTVRRRELEKTIKNQVGNVLSRIQAYGIISPEIRFRCTDRASSGANSKLVTLVTTSGKGKCMFDSAMEVLGRKCLMETQKMDFNILKDGSKTEISETDNMLCSVEGLISTPNGGSTSKAAQYYYLNSRPIDPLPRLAKLILKNFRQVTSRKLVPLILINLKDMPADCVDVNITPDKRTVFLTHEDELLTGMQIFLQTIYQPDSKLCLSVAKNQTTLTIKRESDISASECPSSPLTLGYHSQGLSSVTNSQEDDTQELRALDNGEYSKASSLDAISESSCLKARVHSKDSSFESPSGLSRANQECSTGTRTDEEYEESNLIKIKVIEILPNDVNEIETNLDVLNEKNKKNKRWREDVKSEDDVIRIKVLKVKNEIPDDTPSLGCTKLEHSEIDETDTTIRLTVKSLEMMSSNIPPTDDDALTEKAEDELSQSTEGKHSDKEEMNLESPQSSSKKDSPLNVSIKKTPQHRTNNFSLDRCREESSQQSSIAIKESPQHSSIVIKESPQHSSIVIKESPQHSSIVIKESPQHFDNIKQIVLKESPNNKQIVLGQMNKRKHQKNDVEYVEVNWEMMKNELMDDLNSKKAMKVEFDEDDYSQEMDDNALNIESLGGGGQNKGGIRLTHETFLRMSVCGQFNQGFIIVVVNDFKRSLLIVDQHAADEKRRFEYLIATCALTSQPLIKPICPRILPSHEHLIEQNEDVFIKNGYKIHMDPSGKSGQRLRVTAVPSLHSSILAEEDFIALVDLIVDAPINSKNITQEKYGVDMSLLRPPRVWTLLASKSCRYAVMIGQTLTQRQMRGILDNLHVLQQPWNCPHGRPTLRHLIDLHSVEE
eukprot:GHVL01003844.1.p1 GENE.GHVL01003844.1~~GHVL01003844.1.p1  ORF type:complete len:984 (+),score=186.32 GHVL01003844.1:83-3034(+)